jgi:hypothetical protein
MHWEKATAPSEDEPDEFDEPDELDVRAGVAVDPIEVISLPEDPPSQAARPNMTPNATVMMTTTIGAAGRRRGFIRRL